MTPNKFTVTLMFPKSKIMLRIFPRSKEVMIQSSWNKTAAKTRPQSNLPFCKDHESERRFTHAFHSFSPSAVHSPHSLCQNHQVPGCWGNEQYWWPLTNKNQFLLPALWQQEFIPQTLHFLLIHRVFCARKDLHTFPLNAHPFKSVRKEWKICLSFTALPRTWKYFPFSSASKWHKHDY